MHNGNHNKNSLNTKTKVFFKFFISMDDCFVYSMGHLVPWTLQDYFGQVVFLQDKQKIYDVDLMPCPAPFYTHLFLICFSNFYTLTIHKLKMIENKI